MRYQRTDAFKADYRRLSDQEQEIFKGAARRFNAAADRWVSVREPWPAGLRVTSVHGAPGVFEMTWSFSGPDGRATWEWTEISTADGDLPCVRWRRVGRHDVFRAP